MNNTLLEKMDNVIVFDMYHDDRYESVKADLENHMYIRSGAVVFQIHGTDFYLWTYKDVYSIAAFNRVIGFLEGKYEHEKELKVKKVS